MKSAAVGALLFATPAAHAATVINAGSAGSTFTINYVGKVNGATAPAISASQTFKVLTASSGGLYVLEVLTSNTSIVDSRLRSFGFDILTAGNYTVTAAGLYSNVGANQNYPEGVGFLDACFQPTSNGSCTGGSNGLTSGTSGNTIITFSFANSQSSLTLDNFATRFQSINPAQNGGDSGVGIPGMGLVPEPATWAMMILGFGLIGGALRSRKAQEVRVTYA